MAEALGEQDTDFTISCIEEELRQLTDLPPSSSSDSDFISEDEDSQRQLQGLVEFTEKFLDEFTLLEAEYETEEACEEHTTQVQNENKDMNSTDTADSNMMLCEQREDVQPMATGGQCMAEVDTDASYGDQHIIEELKRNIQKFSEEREQMASALQELKVEAKRLNKQLEHERLEKEVIGVKLGKSQNKFLKLNRVSLAVAQEYSDTLDQLDLEQSLRYEAESYANKVLKEKKAIYRQSLILMQNVQPNEMLVKALDDVRSLTTTLEDTKQDLQTKIASLELQLSERPMKEELLTIQEDLKVAKSEKGQLEEELKMTKEKCSLLEERVKSLEEELQRKEVPATLMEDASVGAPPISLLPPAPPPPPPPPPPPCPFFKTPEDPLAIIKQRRGLRESEGPPVTGDSTKADAMREMMERIKSGVKLRPAQSDRKDQAAVTNKRKTVISQLQGILMDTVRKPARRASRRRISRKAKDAELESILQRRRKIVDTPQKADKQLIIHQESLVTADMKSQSVTPLSPLDDEDKSSSEKQIQKIKVQQNSQRRQSEIRLVTWQ
ncbi:shootin-1-like isoform X2 [Dendropsophus ebraccatus]|uniref:shootin-1-like isoform X2 n=1 Tax=Dendropsophus ebraccatus TaxID=150705 RepID=UPI003831B6C2